MENRLPIAARACAEVVARQLVRHDERRRIRRRVALLEVAPGQQRNRHGAEVARRDVVTEGDVVLVGREDIAGHAHPAPPAGAALGTGPTATRTKRASSAPAP